MIATILKKSVCQRVVNIIPVAWILTRRKKHSKLCVASGAGEIPTYLFAKNQHKSVCQLAYIIFVVYIYIYREREREGERKKLQCIYVYENNYVEGGALPNYYILTSV